MTEQEKVLDGLEKLRLNAGCVYWEQENCEGCLYHRENGCCYAILRDAINLIKAQEPRLVTREEWDKWRHIPDGKRDPLFFQLYKTGGAWILKPDPWHEVAFLTGEIKVWNKKPSAEEMVVKWG